MKKRLIIALGTLLLCFICLSSACPTGQMPNFDGSCIPDPNYNAGAVNVGKTSSTSTLPTSGTYDELYATWERYCRWGTVGITEAQCDQLQTAIDQAYLDENPLTKTKENPEDNNLLNPKSIGEFSNENLDQQRIDGNQLISDVDKIKQLVSDEVSFAASKYSSEVYQQASGIQDGADKISSQEYTAAQTDANNLGSQLANCDQCWQSKPNSEGCQCRNSIQRQINIGSYTHFMTSFQAQQDALNQINDLLKKSTPSNEETPTDYTSTEQTATSSTELTIPTIIPNTQLVPPPSSDSDYSVEVSVAAYHEKEMSELQKYYSDAMNKVFGEHTPQFIDPAQTRAEQNFEQTRSQGIDVVNAKNDYQDALNSGASDSDLEVKKKDYQNKLQKLKSDLQNNVLDNDNYNVDALWQMGTLSKWEGDNQQSYNYYRDALVAAKSKNPFKYQQLMNAVSNPAIRAQLLQEMNPKEKVITLPTVETSPLLKGLQDNLKSLVLPVTDRMKGAAEDIEKISRAFSISDKLTNIRSDLGISPIGDKKNE
ncbi:MAG: hypothetical protein WCV90_02135 [Candidatus Woesearchaeota archaeon]